MTRSLCCIAATLLLTSSAAGQELIPKLIATCNGDTAIGSSAWDTLRIETAIGDTVRIDFHAKDWPMVSGWYFTMKDNTYFQIPEERYGIPPTPLNLLGFTPGKFLSGPALPTSQAGAIPLGRSQGVQIGLVSLGERQDSGQGHLGTLAFRVLSALPTGGIQLENERFILQAPPDSAGTTNGRYSTSGMPGRLRIILPSTNIPEPAITSDFNGNGMVDFADFLAFAKVFGAQQNKDARYDRRFDLVRNGQIDFSDFLLFASHFGKSPVVITG